MEVFPYTRGGNAKFVREDTSPTSYHSQHVCLFFSMLGSDSADYP